MKINTQKITRLGLFSFLLSVGMISALNLPKANAQPSSAPLAAPVSCKVDLVANTHNCSSINEISFPVPPASNKAVMKINLDPLFSPYTRIQFSICYNSTPKEWTVNIGDSATNDGFGGDGATQSNDAELQFYRRNLQVNSNDELTIVGGSPRDMLTMYNLLPASVVPPASKCKLITVSNGQIALGNSNLKHTYNVLKSSYLYALNGQSDSEGSINYDIYAAFNRVISTICPGGRCGSGVSKVTVTLLPGL